MNTEKQDFANTITSWDLGSTASSVMTECEKHGMTYGCTIDCPQLIAGLCELKDTDNKELYKKAQNEQLILHGVMPMLLCNFNEKTWGITKGKKYKMLGEDKAHYFIVNDHKKRDKIFKNYFDKLPDNN